MVFFGAHKAINIEHQQGFFFPFSCKWISLLARFSASVNQSRFTREMENFWPDDALTEGLWMCNILHIEISKHFPEGE